MNEANNPKITKNLQDKILKILKHEMRPALGCTEPISTALACAKLREIIGGIPDSLTLYVSGNLFKNAIAVSVPYTGLKGLKIAAGMGVICGDANLGLEVLKNAKSDDVIEAKQFCEKITIEIKENVPTLYVQACGRLNSTQASITIAYEHTFITEIKLDQKVIFSQAYQDNQCDMEVLDSLNLRDIYDIALSFEESELEFMQEAARLNEALSLEGLKQDYGLGIGRTYLKHTQNNLAPKDLQNQILIYTTAASDARMGGANLPAMTNSGSGNQGITATIPVVITAKYLNKEDKLNCALFLSHLVAIYIHNKLPRLSALCAVSTASIGSFAGIAWLFSEDFGLISQGINTMIGDISGILCDGAANSCSLKVATAIQSAYKSLLLALEKKGVKGDEGIVDNNTDKSIENLCKLAKKSMQATDAQILDIMLKKFNQ